MGRCYRNMPVHRPGASTRLLVFGCSLKQRPAVCDCDQYNSTTSTPHQNIARKISHTWVEYSGYHSRHDHDEERGEFDEASHKGGCLGVG